MNRFDPNALLAQAQKMQADMRKVQDELRNRMVEGSAGGGLVSVVVNGLSEPQAVKIKGDACDPSDTEMLEDLVLVALKAAMDKAKKLNEEEMRKVSPMGGGLGGLF
jgi:DNA-binding YbaB/EbfC family protein